MQGVEVLDFFIASFWQVPFVDLTTPFNCSVGGPLVLIKSAFSDLCFSMVFLQPDFLCFTF